MAKYDYNIDELFGESARRYQSTAPEGMWDALDADLDRSSPRKPAVWGRIAAGVAIVLSAFGTGYYFGNQSETAKELAEGQMNSVEDRGNSTNGGVHSDEVPDDSGEAGVNSPAASKNALGESQNNLVKNQVNSGEARENSPAAIEKWLAQSNAASNSGNGSAGAFTGVRASIEGDHSNEVLINPEWNNEASKTLAVESVDLPIVSDSDKEESPVLLERADVTSSEPAITDQLGPIKCKGCSPWSIGIEGAPVIAFREAFTDDPKPTVGNTAIASRSPEASADEPIWGWSGGIEIAYQGNPRWKFASGINYHQMGQEADVNFSLPDPSPASSRQTLIGSSSAGSINTSLPNTESLSTGTAYESLDGEVVRSSVAQRFSYLEVPVTVTYLMGDGNLSVGIEGGIAGNFLTDNLVMPTQGQDVVIGSTEDARNFIWSAVGGVQLGYQLNANMSIAAGPQVRYGLQSATDNTYFRPYSVGFAAGLSYRL